jgi:hypothetical protein
VRKVVLQVANIARGANTGHTPVTVVTVGVHVLPCN